MFPALRSYGCNLSRFAGRVPNWHRTATTPAMGPVCFSGLGSSDLAHGVVEGQAEHLDVEVRLVSRAWLNLKTAFQTTKYTNHTKKEPLAMQ